MPTPMPIPMPTPIRCRPRCSPLDALPSAPPGGSGGDPSSGFSKLGPSFTIYSGAGGVGGRGVAVLPRASLLNLAPADGAYEASVSVVLRPRHRIVLRPRHRIYQASLEQQEQALQLPPASPQLPVDLESGCGMPLRVRVDSEGLHISRDGLDRAVAEATGSPPEQGPSNDNGSQGSSIFVVVDLWS